MKPLTLFLLLSTLANANDPPTAQISLSTAGKARLSQNLVTVEQNLKNASENIETTQKNIKTLRDEVKELEGLEKDFSSLKKKYSDYVVTAEKEIAANDKTIGELSKETSLRKPTSTSSVAPNKYKLEMESREDWKRSASESVQKARQLLNATNENLKKLQARREPLLKEVEIQLRKESDYQRLLTELQGKKTELQKLLSSQ